MFQKGWSASIKYFYLQLLPMVKIHVHSNFSLNNVAQEFYAVTLFRELLTNLHDDLVRHVFQPLLIE